MSDPLLLSSAYFPPAEYFSLIARSGAVSIEKWENYHKQTYRNRCVILGANGPLTLIVPVLRGSFHKTPVSDLVIDYSRPWRELHIKSIVSAYAMAPYYEFYIDGLRCLLEKRLKYLLDLNMEALRLVMDQTDLAAEVMFTKEYTPATGTANDFRYQITPKRESAIGKYTVQPYLQVFSDRHGFTPGLSIIDILLNNGPGTNALLHRSLE